MSSEIDAACPVNQRKEMAEKLDKGEQEAAGKLWKACADALVENSTEFKALADRAKALAEQEKQSGKVNFPEEIRLGIAADRLSDQLFPRAVEMMNQITPLQKPDPKCHLYESHWKESKNGGPLMEKEDVKISCTSPDELRGRFTLPPTRPDGAFPPPMNRPKPTPGDAESKVPQV
jgi:hypothetical protein